MAVQGMPMVLYSQIVIWGQSAVCIFLQLGWKVVGDQRNPTLLSAMVPLGMESGPDVVPPVVFHSNWSQLVVQEAESYSLLLIAVLGTVFLSLKDTFIERGWLEEADHGVKELSESFRRADKGAIPRSLSSPDALMSGQHRSGVWNTSNHFEVEESELLIEKAVPKSRQNVASFGSHISFIFLTAFFSFVVGLFGRVFESRYSFFQDHNFISGFCMFEVSMCCAYAVMQALLRHTRIIFNRDWFMRICGIMLDLLIVAALASAGYFPSAHVLPSYTPEIIVMIVVCAIWNVVFVFTMGPHMFPNFWFDRSVVLMGDSMGHAFMGLLFARCLDPTMETPVPAAFAYKLMFIFLPTSAGKNSLIFSMVNLFGLAWAFIICVLIMAVWYAIFKKYYRPRFVQKKSEPPDENKCADISLSTSLSTGPVIGTPSRRLSTAADLLAAADEARKNGMPLVLGDSSSLAAISPELNAKQAVVRNSPPPKEDVFDILGNYVTFQQKSLILNNTNLKLVGSWLTQSFSLSTWRLVYSLRNNGASLETLLSNCSAHKGQHGMYMTSSRASAYIVLVEDSWGYVFGAFLSHSLVNRSEYYGSGENFVFSVMPVAQKYTWTGKNDLFVVSNPTNFAIGGGGEGFSFQLDDELATGVSNRSETYNNEILSSNEFFKCLNVEVWELCNSKESFGV